MSNDPVAMALRAALEVGESAALRIALSKRLLELNRSAEALLELERVLSAEPSNQEALEHAARAAAAAGDSTRAQAYQLALTAHRRQTNAETERVTASSTPAVRQMDPEPSAAPAPSAASKLRLVSADDASEP